MNVSANNTDTIRDLVSNLGCQAVDSYCIGSDCLNALGSLEKQLLNEDVVNRDVRIYLSGCEVVKNDLIPIIIYSKDVKILTAAIRLLVNVTLPPEFLLPLEDAPVSTEIYQVRKILQEFSLSSKKAFLNADSTLSVVTMLREAIIKSEKHQYPLKEEDCMHLKNCLLLLRNILHFPDEVDTFDNNMSSLDFEWQSVQNKLIWNLFVQGLDAALLLMLNCKHKEHWTVPLALIIALLYRNQNIHKVHQALQLVSSPSESSGDDEGSDGSKRSSTSISSEPTKISNRLSDSGCPQSSDSTSTEKNHSPKFIAQNSIDQTSDCCSSDIHTKFEKVRITDDDDHGNNSSCSNHSCSPTADSGKGKSRHYSSSGTNSDDVSMENDSGSSSSSESPYRKKVKSNCCLAGGASINQEDSAMSECSSSDKLFDDASSKDRRVQKSHKTVHKRCTHASVNVHESDSSNEDMRNRKTKFRSHPPTCRRGKSPRRNSGCTPSVCMDAAFAASCNKGRIRYPLWEKRNSVTTLVDLHSPAPTEEEIGNLLKEFTLSFMHSGYSKLIIDIKALLLNGPYMAIDKSLFFWLITYFLNLASTLSLTLDHLNGILTFDVISYLIYESVMAWEAVELHCNENARITKYALRHLNLSVTALREVTATIDVYSRKPLLKDKAFITELCGKLAELQDLRQLPLLLIQNFHPVTHTKKYLEDVIVLNHQILMIIERGSEQCWLPKRVNIATHIKQFATKSVIKNYGRILEDFKSNSQIVNDCVFTMMHHVAGDIHASQLLIQPAILKTFSGMLQEDIVLEQYQEDLVMYILNKFSQQIKKRNMKRNSGSSDESGDECDHTSSSSSDSSSSCLLFDDDDDLFWWYLQFEQDKDPISRISEHILMSKRDILQKLLLKGIIAQEKYEQLEDKMEEKQARDINFELIPDKRLMHIPNFDDDITNLLRSLVQSGHRQHFTWLQDILLETCYAKLGLTRHVVEPVAYCSIKMMLSIPIVPFTEEQKSILQDETFIKLLQKLGLQLTTSTSHAYPRIPSFWSPDLLFTIAARLGPIKKDKLKFTYEDLMHACPNQVDAPIDNIYPMLPPLSSCSTLSSWLTAVQQSKEHYRTSVHNIDILHPMNITQGAF